MSQKKYLRNKIDLNDTFNEKILKTVENTEALISNQVLNAFQLK